MLTETQKKLAFLLWDRKISDGTVEWILTSLENTTLLTKMIQMVMETKTLTNQEAMELVDKILA